MRIIHAADIHGGLPRYAVQVSGPNGNSRVDEFEHVLDKLASHAINLEADVVLIAGDTFDNRSPSVTLLRIFTAFLARVATRGILIKIIPGNHDGASVIGDELTHTLYWLKALHREGVTVHTRPTIEHVDTRGGTSRMVLVAFPYPHRRAFTGHGLVDARSPEEQVIEGGRKMEALVARYAVEARKMAVDAGDIPVVFMGHLTALGSRLSSEHLMRMEWDVAIPLEVLEAFDYAALGHIHKMQGLGPRQMTERASQNASIYADGDRRVWYPGSPIFSDFSEAGDERKGFLLVDIDTRTHEVLVRPLSSEPRRMSRIKLAYHPLMASAALSDLDVLDGQMVSLTITGDERPPDSWVVGVERAIRTAGAHFLKTTFVIEDQTVPRELRKEDPTLDLMNKEAALRHFLAANQLPDEPFLTAGRVLIEAHQ